MISPQVIEQIQQSVDIVEIVSDYVRLRQFGSQHTGLCPFHNEKTPSLRVHGRRSELAGTFHCFGCDAKGGVIKFVMEIERLNFPAAVCALADRAGISIDKQRTSAVAAAAYRQDVACSKWYWQQKWQMVRSQLDAALVDGPPADREVWDWCCTLNRMLLHIEGLGHMQKVDAFRLVVKGVERAAWKAEMAEEKRFEDYWMGMAGLPLAGA